MNVADLIEQLKTIPDWRRGRDPQHPLWLLLLLTLLGIMSGYSSLRGLAEFTGRHQSEVAEYLGLAPTKSASYSTLQKMAHRVNSAALTAVFLTWASRHEVAAGTAVGVDGKALESTVINGQGAGQNFVMVVHACVHQRGDVIGQCSFENGKSSEIGAVRELLKQLDLKGVWFTLDALHCQKKPLNKS
jgi:DDE_Tnp_1-associated